MLQCGIDPLRAVATASVRSERPVRTPHAVVHRQGKASLRYFPAFSGAPPGDREVGAPLFVAMPLINTWVVFDLLPGRSVVGALVEAGTPVYLLDWGEPAAEDAHLSLSDVIDDTLPRALDRARRHARLAGLPPAAGSGGEMDVLGYCVGGTFLAISVAREMARGRLPARRMALLAAPIDFHACGRLSAWARPETFPLDDLVDGFGNFPKDLMRSSFAWLKPAAQWAKWRALVERSHDPAFTETWRAIEAWNADGTDFPGEAYREYVRRCYFENALVGPSRWFLAGEPVDLATGTIPALVLACDRDHICPPAAAEALARAWGGAVETRMLSGGHVGVCLGSDLPRAIREWMAG